MHKSPQAHIDINAQPLIACSCGSIHFMQIYQFHRVPRFLLGAADDAVMLNPHPIFKCANPQCGKVHYDPKELI